MDDCFSSLYLASSTGISQNKKEIIYTADNLIDAITHNYETSPIDKTVY